MKMQSRELNPFEEWALSNIHKINNKCEAFYGVPRGSINSSIKTGKIIDARHTAQFLIKKLYTSLSLQFIGFYTGNKDHASLLHALKTRAGYYEVDSNLRSEIEFIEKRIRRVVSLHFSKYEMPERNSAIDIYRARVASIRNKTNYNITIMI